MKTFRLIILAFYCQFYCQLWLI